MAEGAGSQLLQLGSWESGLGTGGEGGGRAATKWLFHLPGRGAKLAFSWVQGVPAAFAGLPIALNSAYLLSESTSSFQLKTIIGFLLETRAVQSNGEACRGGWESHRRAAIPQYPAESQDAPQVK